MTSADSRVAFEKYELLCKKTIPPYKYLMYNINQFIG